MASVRFICGTQDLHKQLEATIATFFGSEDTILYAISNGLLANDFDPDGQPQPLVAMVTGADQSVVVPLQWERTCTA